MSRTGFVYHPDCLRHDTGPRHPERAARLQAILDRMRERGLQDECLVELARPIELTGLARVHTQEHVARMEAVCRRGPTLADASDTVVSTDSFRAALLAAGGLLQAVDHVLDGSWSNAFVAVRPPGHHAESSRALGFCLFNNVALAAAALREREGIERVAILDFDVHHGNGTQHLFERDPSVFYASLHQYPHYPGTGAANERGFGEGEGTTLNCPQPAGTGDREWLEALEKQVLPAFEQFRPDFLLLSAGFDAHAADPLSGTRLTEEGYRRITRRSLELAARLCHGRVVSVLEGGYDLKALASCVQAHVEELVAE